MPSVVRLRRATGGCRSRQGDAPGLLRQASPRASRACEPHPPIRAHHPLKGGGLYLRWANPPAGSLAVCVTPTLIVVSVVIPRYTLTNTAYSLLYRLREMSDVNVPVERPCKTCGRTVLDMDAQGTVHVGGGEMWQKCRNASCGWEGSQYQKHLNCPRCGDGTQLVDDHRAS